jgi:ABC-2 type transport system ATP-binding protein
VADTAIAVTDLTRRYGDYTAVDRVSFAVRRGETFGILGPNGAGKTTTLEMIEGLREPTAGSIEVLGEPVWPDPRRIQRRIGVQLQTTSLFDRLTARELLELFARFYERRDGRPRAAEALATVGLAGKSEARAKELSGGQRQRLAIALALVHDPDVVFLDEPTTGLDPQARRNLWDVVRDVRAAEQLCERVAIMDEGRLIALDTPAGLVAALDADARISFTTRGRLPVDPASLPGVREASVADGAFVLYTRDTQATVLALLGAATDVRLDDLSIRGPSLEDVFLQLTGREFRE